VRAAFHDPEDNYRLTLDLANNDEHKPLQEKEALAEALRLFYVAVTRAKHRCTMVWRAKTKPDKCAPAYLLGTGGQPAIVSDDIAIADVPQPNDDLLRPGNETPPRLDARQFTGTIDRSWGISSFSRLISGRETDVLDEGPVVEPAAEEEQEASGIHAFPKGMRAGTCLHEILEEVDFANLAGAPEIVQRRLRAYGIEGFDEIVLENLRQLCALPLSAGADQFTLAGVPNESRMAELQFAFPVNSLTTAKLAEVFALDELPLRIDRLQFQPVNGFMNGFVDLIFEQGGRFYFADWKSNWLGSTTRAYKAAAITAEMHRNFYTLQLCLYSVALHRYLRVRKPGYDFDQHFGGAFYVFLRGIDPAWPANGVYFQRPRRDFIENLNRIFGS
jgi:exodeoxyribonuclease V beta subunit